MCRCTAMIQYSGGGNGMPSRCSFFLLSLIVSLLDIRTRIFGVRWLVEVTRYTNTHQPNETMSYPYGNLNGALCDC